MEVSSRTGDSIRVKSERAVASTGVSFKEIELPRTGDSCRLIGEPCTDKLEGFLVGEEFLMGDALRTGGEFSEDGGIVILAIGLEAVELKE